MAPYPALLASCPAPETHHLAVHVSPFLLISSLHVLTPIFLVCAGDVSTACHLKASPTCLAHLFSRISHPSLCLGLLSQLISSQFTFSASAHFLSSSSLFNLSQVSVRHLPRFIKYSASLLLFYYGGVYSVARCRTVTTPFPFKKPCPQGEGKFSLATHLRPILHLL